MTSLDSLLDVQERDTALDRLRHRRETLPERAELAEIESRIAELDAQIAGVGAKRDDAAGRQDKLEGELGAAERRIADIERRMYSGEVSATRDLMAMTDEVESLRRRSSGFEDQAFEALEEREGFEAEVDELLRQRVAVDEQADKVRAAIAAAEAEIDAEAADEARDREKSVVGLPADLLAEYERLRQRLGGIGAARLAGESCTGCHLALPATEIDRIRRLPLDALVHCDQCGRILVR